MIEFLVILASIWIIAAVIQDFRNREIANWINFSLLLFALVFRGFFSIFTGNYMFLVFGVVGLAVFFVIGHLFYYGRLFAGGDAKLFIALGAVIPFANNFRDNNLIFIVFIIALLFGGGIYSLIYSSFLAVKNKKKFSKRFKELFKEQDSLFYGLIVFFVVFLIYSFYTKGYLYLVLPTFLLSLFFVYLFAKAVEDSCMFIKVNVSKLTIGDWLGEDLKVKKRVIKPYWEGLNEEQLKFIQKNYKDKVLVKQGIPFSPAFLIAFLTIVYIQFFRGANFGFY